MSQRTPVLVADYGLNQYYGGLHDLEARLGALRAAGYDGLERLPAADDASAVSNAALFRRLGMCFATASAPTPDRTIRWAAAFGCDYVWVSAQAREFDAFCRQVRAEGEACAAAGVRVALHNHMGTAVESQEELEAFLRECPECALILDTAHLAAVGGDPVGVVHRYPDRLVQVHFKDWIAEREAVEWYQRGRFCELGAGNIGLDNAAVARALREVGYAGPVAVEQDTHLRDPLEDLRVSREYLRATGF